MTREATVVWVLQQAGKPLWESEILKGVHGQGDLQATARQLHNVLRGPCPLTGFRFACVQNGPVGAARWELARDLTQRQDFPDSELERRGRRGGYTA